MRRGDDVCRDRTLEVVHVSAENPVHEGREALAVLAFEIEAESLQRRMPVAIGDCPVKADADHGGLRKGMPRSTISQSATSSTKSTDHNPTVLSAMIRRFVRYNLDEYPPRN